MKRAFSLLETVFAIALVGFILILVVNLVPSSVLAVRRGEEQLQAENLARSVLEEARAAPFSALAVGTSTPPSPDPNFTLSREVFAVPNASVDRTLGVRVTVGWSRSGRPQQIVREVWVSSVRG